MTRYVSAYVSSKLIRNRTVKSQFSIENYSLRRTLIRRKEGIYESLCNSVKILPGNRVSQTAYCLSACEAQAGWLTGKIILTDRQVATNSFQTGISAKIITIIHILITTGYLKYPLAQKILIRVVNIALMAIIPERIDQTSDYTPLNSTPRRNKTLPSLVRVPPSKSASTFLLEILVGGSMTCLSLVIAISFL